MARNPRKRFIIAGAGVLIAAALFGTLGIAATKGRAENTPTASPTPFLEPSTPVPATATQPAPPAPIAPVEVPMSEPFGPVAAEPYRVFTGDGDCLNVRPVPGTTFQGDARTCVPEGFLLWLFGEKQTVDGRDWRYALGEGWVALEFVKPAPGATTGFGPFSSVTVSGQAGEVTNLATVTKDGQAVMLPTLPAAMRGLGDVPPALSPNAKWAAFGREERYVPTLTIRNMTDGSEAKYPNTHIAGWSPTNRLLVRITTNCPQQCTWSTGWLDPREGVIHPLTDKQNDWYTFVWAHDGQSLFVVEGGELKQAFLSGEIREVTVNGLDEKFGWGQLSLSEDGKKLLSSPFQGAIVVVDLQTGAVSKVQRAPQVISGGRCGGGGGGTLTTWLDANTVIWHESYAEKGGNGITISRIDGGNRRLIPFFTVSDIRKAAPNLVSFVTWEDATNGQKNGFQLTWLLDTTTGEARPVTVGASPEWQ